MLNLDSDFKIDFISAAAKAFFASAWADAAEEANALPTGCEIMEVMPCEIDKGAIEAANYLYNQMDTMQADGKGLEAHFSRCVTIANGDREPSVETFGHYSAMQAMGHGVGLHDAMGRSVYQITFVPYVDFSAFDLEKDYF